jgi:hypothetical protein
MVFADFMETDLIFAVTVFYHLASFLKLTSGWRIERVCCANRIGNALLMGCWKARALMSIGPSVYLQLSSRGPKRFRSAKRPKTGSG